MVAAGEAKLNVVKVWPVSSWSRRFIVAGTTAWNVRESPVTTMSSIFLYASVFIVTARDFSIETSTGDPRK